MSQTVDRHGDLEAIPRRPRAEGYSDGDLVSVCESRGVLREVLLCGLDVAWCHLDAKRVAQGADAVPDERQIPSAENRPDLVEIFEGRNATPLHIADSRRASVDSRMPSLISAERPVRTQRPTAHRGRRSLPALRAIGLVGEPCDEIGAPVADVPADLEAARAGAEVAPVPQVPSGTRRNAHASCRVSICSPGRSTRWCLGSLVGVLVISGLLRGGGRSRPEPKSRLADEVLGGIQSMIGDTCLMESKTVIEVARRAAGLSQRRPRGLAGTQSSVSEYEARRKSPTLEVVERLLAAADHELVRSADCDLRLPGGPRSRLVRRTGPLWSVPIPDCVARVQVLKYIFHTDDDQIWDLSDTNERMAFYELAQVRGTEQMLLDSVDGVLLLQAWPHLNLPDVVRAAWQPVIDAAVALPTCHRETLAG